MNINELVKERIESNKQSFDDNELNIIEKNIVLMKKMYLLGLLDTASSMRGVDKNE